MISHQVSLLITSCYCPMKSHSHSLPFSSLCSLSINACHICSTADQLPVWCTARNQQKQCKLLHKGCHVLLPMQLAVCMLIVLRLTVNQSLQCCVQMPRQYSVCLEQSILQLHFIMMTLYQCCVQMPRQYSVCLDQCTNAEAVQCVSRAVYTAATLHYDDIVPVLCTNAEAISVCLDQSILQLHFIMMTLYQCCVQMPRQSVCV